MKYIILGTAGHIDHGKSTLVKALTGTDPDRLREEKERGITLDLGFASLDLPGGNRLGIVDVPGHEGLIKDRLALVKDEVRSFVKGTFLEKSPIVPVSSKTGEDLPVLVQELAKLANEVTPKSSSGILRLPIDREL